MISVLIADDQAMVRSGFSALLTAQSDIVVVAEVADGAAAISAARKHNPDVVLMDIRMPVLDGIEATRQILAGGHHPHILILTTFDLDEYVFEALRAGASGFLLKDAPAPELINAVRVVAAGDALLAPSVTKRLIADYAHRRPVSAHDPRLALLTPRELDVMRLVAVGKSNGEIAEDLVVAEQTVKTHVGKIFTKLNVRDRAQAVVFAYESGLVAPGS